MRLVPEDLGNKTSQLEMGIIPSPTGITWGYAAQHQRSMPAARLLFHEDLGSEASYQRCQFQSQGSVHCHSSMSFQSFEILNQLDMFDAKCVAQLLR